MLPIPREEKKQQITNLLICVLVPVFVFACKRTRATFFQILKLGHMGPPFLNFKTWAYNTGAYRITFFQFLRHGHTGSPFYNF